PLVPGDRRTPIRLTQHGQDAGDRGLPEVRRHEPERRDRAGCRVGTDRRSRGSAARRASACRLNSAAPNPEETTHLQLARPVSRSDGPAGPLSGVVIDPDERRVSHIVVEDANGAVRLVPADLLVRGQAPNSTVALSCTVAEVSSRETIRSFSYVGLDSFPKD